MGFAVRWLEDSPFGPNLDVLSYVEDMGQARGLAAAADLERRPVKSSRLSPHDPLTALAREHPGELLWRVAGGDGRWRVGASGAARLRDADVERFTATGAAARERRSRRRRGKRR